MKSLLSLFRKPPAGPVPDLADLRYGKDDPRQTLDYWKSPIDSAAPAPALIFFHGGGFVRGKKYHCRLLREMRALGVAAISANYRLTRRRGTTVHESMSDGRLVLDYVREHAEEWNIDPGRIALTGKSSGGCIALWLGMTESIRGVATYNTPTSIDPELLVNDIGARSILYYWPIWAMMTDVMTPKGLRCERVRQLVEKYSALELVHQKSPPLFLEYSADRPESGIGWLEALHCVRYGELMREQYDKYRLPCILSSPASSPDVDPVNFLSTSLEVQPTTYK